MILRILLCPLLLATVLAVRSGTPEEDEEGYFLPIDQRLTPAGRQIELPKLRPQVIRLSPDGKLIATSGKTSELVLIDPRSGLILQRVALPGERGTNDAPEAVSSHILVPDKKGQVSFAGLVFSPSGRRIYLSNVDGSIKVFQVDSENHVTPLDSIRLPSTHLSKRKEEIPAGLAISNDGRRLYVVLNLSNRLLELDLATAKPIRTFEVGMVPYEVVLAGEKAYVSNWGGRRPDATSVTGPAGHGTKVRVDPVRFIANEGSVSVINLATGMVERELLTGLHASALALAPNGGRLYVANAASDTISVIDVRSDRIVDTISLRWASHDPFGAAPNALAFDETGKTLYVCNGTQNAVAVVALGWRARITGLIPTGWYPGAIAYDSGRRSLYVANIKGIGSGARLEPEDPVKFNSHQHIGTISLIPVPDKRELERLTERALKNFRWSLLKNATLPPRAGQPPRPVPERAGEPSVFNHVIYIIKENRTYDQVLGDMKEGNGAKDLCIFGERVTPNQHKMSREFALLDNTFCASVLSADGHQWTDTAYVTDYLEKSFAGFPRSYPDGMEDHDVDALAYAPSGFIWDNALAHGKSIRDYGEFTIGVTGWRDRARKGSPHFVDFYRDFTNQTSETRIASRPAIESLRPYMMTSTIGWDLDVPDVFRAAQFIKELHEFEGMGRMPALSIICLPNDHTSGTKVHSPTPEAQVADNDLALGQIVEAVSQSKFWKDTCILVIEDDPQGGWDHVSSYRTTAYVISPYTKRHALVHERYNQVGLVRTIELILGLPPMNQLDATAEAMVGCFTDRADFSPYVVAKNNIPLDQMNPEPKAVKQALRRRFSIMSAALPLKEADKCPEDLLNRILWNAQKGDIPYPGWAVTHQVDND